MKTLFKLARKFQLKYGQANPPSEDPFASLNDLFKGAPTRDPNMTDEEWEEDAEKTREEMLRVTQQEWEKREAARKAQEEQKKQEQQKAQANKTPFTTQDAGVIVNHFLPEIKKKFPNIKGVTFNFMSSGEVSMGTTDAKLASSLRTQFSTPMAMSLRQYLIQNKRMFKEQKVSYSI